MPVPVELQQSLTLTLILCLRVGSCGEGRGGLHTTEPLKTSGSAISLVHQASPAPEWQAVGVLIASAQETLPTESMTRAPRLTHFVQTTNI